MLVALRVLPEDKLVCAVELAVHGRLFAGGVSAAL